jgi:hypothetical protein
VEPGRYFQCGKAVIRAAPGRRQGCRWRAALPQRRSRLSKTSTWPLPRYAAKAYRETPIEAHPARYMPHQPGARSQTRSSGMSSWR